MLIQQHICTDSDIDPVTILTRRRHTIETRLRLPDILAKLLVIADLRP